jgi:hypothetical protein
MRDWDLWWHLKVGELAIDRGSTLPVDDLSLLHDGTPWIYKDLCSEVILASLHRGLGELGLILFKVVGVATFLLLVWGVARRRLDGVSLAVTGLVFWISSFRLTERTELFSLLLWPVTLILVDSFRRRGGVLGLRDWLMVGGVAWLWANLHRGCMLGIGLWWSLAAFELVTLAIARGSGRAADGRRGLRAVGCAGLVTGVSLLNPSGTGLFAQSVVMFADDGFRQAVSEWERLGPGAMLAEFPLAVVWMLATLVLVPLAMALGLRRGGGVGLGQVEGTGAEPRGERVGLWEVLLAMGSLLLGMNAPRMLPFMAVATAGPVRIALSSLLRGVGKGQMLRRTPLLASVLALGVGFGAGAGDASAGLGGGLVSRGRGAVVGGRACPWPRLCDVHLCRVRAVPGLAVAAGDV